MSLIKGILQEELNRQERLLLANRNASEKIPKGSLRKRNVNGKVYFYRVFRSGKKVHSEYLCSAADEKKAAFFLKQEEKRKKLKEEINGICRDVKELRQGLEKLSD